VSSAREAILRRVDAATAAATAPGPVARDYRRSGSLDRPGRTLLLCERIAEYGADVQQVAPDGLRAAIAAAFAGRNATRIVIPPGLPVDWRPEGLALAEDDGLGPGELDRMDGALTGCALAIAETGTIVLAGGPHEGRRALTLVPDLHVCVVAEDDIVELVPEAMARLGDLLARQRRPLTLVSGPSATSDIELSRVEGVHGPRSLVVLVVNEQP
jgi:L-lactate dehydrogenase complex protein LldG